MLKKIITLAVIAGLTGCAAKSNTDNMPVPVDAATLDSQLEAQQAQIVKIIENNQQTQQQSLTALTDEVKSLQTQLADLNQKQQPKDAQVIPVEVECDVSPIGDKFILGATEHVYIDEVKARFKTRIDTGAESSSLDARNIILFERDGKQWVRFDVFTLGEDNPAQTFESKVERFVRIKQDANENSDRRPVIHAHLQIGKYKAETDLNLVDRSHLEFPLLLGRKFMQDIAVVDVSQTYIHGKPAVEKATSK
ncbi:RimK/LysX family protein [Shewanella waksmanii]|uniref:ATP-dependent zinc protease family protein n=1 Tax=Shewanella waksmanii TaxID=213783 RepID=UPI00373640AE